VKPKSRLHEERFRAKTWAAYLFRTLYGGRYLSEVISEVIQALQSYES
jgi:hypothetical protein